VATATKLDKGCQSLADDRGVQGSDAPVKAGKVL